MAPSENNGLSAVQNAVPMKHFQQQMAKAHRWYEVVRCLRAFYDHFRIAFPHLEELPKSYTDDWAEQFKETAREFVKSEDMHSVQKVLTGAGYGTEKWMQISAKDAADIEQAFARLIEAVEHIDDDRYISTEESPNADTKIIPFKQNTDDSAIEALQKRFEESRKENHNLLEEIDQQKQHIADLEGQIRRQNKAEEEAEEHPVQRTSAQEADTRELDALQKRFEKAKKENHELLEEIDAQKKHIVTLEGQIRRLKNTGIESTTEATAPQNTPSETSDASAHDKLQRRFEDLKKDHQELQETFAKKEEELQDLNAEMQKLLANFEKASTVETDTQRKLETPSSMGAQVREYEQKLKANELLIQGLRSEIERAQQAVEEYKEEMQRQRERRRIFEEEMEEERQNLREQMQKLKRLLAQENHNLSLEELEEMESEELLSYIEDVETEKQRALAGLEAIDAQEESYQKQLDAQQEELGTIQKDLDRYKESNLATEMDSAEETIQAQREQLETLLNFSKNLKAQVAHLKERQDPLRNLVERLNLQEKALIRYIRINHDRSFMPSQAYDKQNEE